MVAVFGLVTITSSAEEVYSSNIVGYTKLDVSAGSAILGQQFQSVGGSSNPLSAIVPSGDFDEWGTDSIQVWDGSDYVDYIYYGEDAGGVGADGLAGWGDVDQAEINETIVPGQGFWVNASGDATITVSGEVPSGNTIDIAAGLNLVSSPIPVEIDIQKVVPSGDFDEWGTDSIQVWDGSDYVDYIYYGEDAGGVGADGLAGWGDVDQNAAVYRLSVGQGFWVNASGAATFTFQTNQTTFATAN